MLEHAASFSGSGINPGAGAKAIGPDPHAVGNTEQQIA